MLQKSFLLQPVAVVLRIVKFNDFVFLSIEYWKQYFVYIVS